MSFPTVRPEDAARLPFHVQERLRRRLAEECAAAAARHREILDRRLLAGIPLEPESVTRPRRDELGRPSLADSLSETALARLHAYDRDRKRTARLAS